MGFAGMVELFVHVLWPSRCPACGASGPAPCPACWARLERAPVIPPPPGVDRIRSLFRYEGVGRDLIVRLKYGNARSVLGWLAVGMAALVRAPAAGYDAVTWVPTTRARRRSRGFDQAEILARAVARRLRTEAFVHAQAEIPASACTNVEPTRPTAKRRGRHPPVAPLLTRLPGPAQTGRTRRERHEQPPAFVATRPVPAHVLLIDDVFTTGVTVSAAAQALKLGGATTVDVVTAACTPLKVWEPSADP